MINRMIGWVIAHEKEDGNKLMIPIMMTVDE